MGAVSIFLDEKYQKKLGWIGGPRKSRFWPIVPGVFNENLGFPVFFPGFSEC